MARRLIHADKADEFDMRVEADQHRRKTDQRMHGGDKLRHRGHPDALGNDPAYRPADHDHDE
ncbi:hypothetical protein D3C87_2190750 [compost metagenome]